MFDVAIIGAGVVGAMVARELAKYQLKSILLEKKNDVAMGASRANSGIVHAGYDCAPGSLKARLNVEGAAMMEEVCKTLGVKFKRNGSLVIGFDEEDRKGIEKLMEKGKANGVEVQFLDQAGVRALEPNIGGNVTCALYAPTGGIVCPYDLTIAALGNAMDNGAECKRNFPVTAIEKIPGGYRISSENGEVEARFVVNCAGLYSDTVAKMVGDDSISVHPRKGEYILLDKECGGLVRNTIFRTPTKMGKGILVSPTVDGNLLLGPTSVDKEDKEDKDTTEGGFAEILSKAKEYVENLPAGKAITSFCGLRAVGNTGDFIITSRSPGFVNAAGIESPGLSASPAIAKYIAEMLKEQGLELVENPAHIATRVSSHHFRDASLEEKNAMIRENPAYGRIICRCEGVTEGEILDAIRRNPGATDLDGVKRRTRAQMGRCQGGFCMPYVTELLAKELGIAYEDVTKCGGESLINVEKTKGGMAQ